MRICITGKGAPGGGTAWAWVRRVSACPALPWMDSLEGEAPERPQCTLTPDLLLPAQVPGVSLRTPTLQLAFLCLAQSGLSTETR